AAGIFQPSAEDLVVTLRLEASARWVAEYYPVEHTRNERDGGLTVRMRVGDPALLTQLMLRLGASAELVEPLELAEEVRGAALEALANYS
ncbi:MAG: WYL domain-containing protein, partial [Nocardioidaceae bacterium]